MERKRKILTILVVVLALVLVGLTAGGIWYKSNYVAVQGESVSRDLTTLTISSLTIEDVVDMDQLAALEEVNAQGCRDYDALMSLQRRHPGCKVHYTVLLNGQEYPEDAQEVTLTALTSEEMALFAYLPEVSRINAEDCTDYAMLRRLQEQYPDYDVSYSLEIGGKEYDMDTAALEVSGLTDEDIAMLEHLTALESIHIMDPVADPEALLDLVESRPEVTVTWEMELLGVDVDNTTTEVDLSGIALTGTEAISRTLAYFPNVEKVIMSDCGIDNETMAAFREEKREEYKVVWTVQCGKLTARTDDTFFMPVKYNVYYFHDEDAYNLRYCEDMVCIDIGHMSVKDISFVEFMPHLKYLILAHTTVLDITPLSNCKELVFLELDWTGIKDYEPLLGCTALEDLNLGYTYGDEKIIAQMTWLKNLWWIGRGYSTRILLEEALPDTHLEFSAKHTVGNGWRKLPNYYDMRDILGMHYM